MNVISLIISALSPLLLVICLSLFNFMFLPFREMATQGLFPDEGRSISQKIDLKYPRVRDMLECIIKHQPKVLEFAEIETREHLLFPSKTYDAMIKFLLKCFESDMLQDDPKKAEFLPTVEALCSLIEHAMAVEGSAELHANASKALIDIAAHFPEVPIIGESTSPCPSSLRIYSLSADMFFLVN